MGKGTRNRTTRPQGRRDSRGPYFHGGVPGKQPGDVLEPACRLGLQFQYLNPAGIYSPHWVYLTASSDVATGYASRYLEPGGERTPGDVYEIEPLEPPQPDPDYPSFPGVFLRCRDARIVRVVQTGVSLTRTQENYLERHYQVWGEPGYPVWDEHGLIIPSEQMAANGVTREWTTLLLPWLGPSEVDATGLLSIANRSGRPWATMLEVIPSLDRDCQIETVHHPLRTTPTYRCAACGHHPDTQADAALHQLGAHPVRMLAHIYELDELPIPPLVQAAQTRDPARWHWLTT